MQKVQKGHYNYYEIKIFPVLPYCFILIFLELIMRVIDEKGLGLFIKNLNYCNKI